MPGTKRRNHQHSGKSKESNTYDLEVHSEHHSRHTAEHEPAKGASKESSASVEISSAGDERRDIAEENYEDKILAQTPQKQQNSSEERVIDDYVLIPGTNQPQLSSPAEKNAPSIVDPEAKKSRFSEIDGRQLKWYTHHDLRERYNISFRFVLMKCLKWLGLAVVAWFTYLYVYGLAGIIAPESFTQHLFLITARLTLAIFLFALLYWELFRRTLEMRIVGFRFILTHGVLWKIRASIAIIPVMQITVKQTGLDLLFDVYRIAMWVPGSSDHDDMLVIPGLNRTDAYDFHNFMTIELNRQVFLAGSALEAEDQMRLHEAMEEEY
jgi:hypothetical protein